MKRILFIYNNPLDGSYGGSQRTKQALSGLKQNFEVETYSCIKKTNRLITLIRNAMGFSGSLSLKDCINILRLVKCRNFDAVFFDVSLHGRLVRTIKKYCPNSKVIVNYHNCEAQYLGDMYKTKGRLYYPIYKAGTYNEKLSVRFADFHVLISEEDRIQLGINENFCLIPVTLSDAFSEQHKKNNADEPYLLFVGSAQYANIEGAKFIIENIAPEVDKKILIVGKGMRSAFPCEYKNVEIRDYVESLSDIYKNASAFVSPLFFGSGAKIKVAEALMYGKRIIGTPLSFYGYDIQYAKVAVCNSKNDFLQAINETDINICFYEENRKLFLDKYSAENNSNYYFQLSTVFKGNKN